jgi:hypothetical protein
MHPFRTGSPDLAARAFSVIRSLILCSVVVLICGMSQNLAAKDTFSVAGKVKNVKGRGFPMAIVTVDNGMGMTVAVFSKPNGRFVIKGLRPGRYQISAEQDGYPKVSQSIVLPGARSVSFVLRGTPKRFNAGPERIHEAMNNSPQTQRSL